MEYAVKIMDEYARNFKKDNIKSNTDLLWFSVLNISLKMSTAKLEEISVVSTGYETLPKERSTGSFGQIDKNLINRNVGTDLISRLKGLAPSLLIDERNWSKQAKYSWTKYNLCK